MSIPDFTFSVFGPCQECGCENGTIKQSTLLGPGKRTPETIVCQDCFNKSLELPPEITQEEKIDLASLEILNMVEKASAEMNGPRFTFEEFQEEIKNIIKKYV